MDTDLFILLTVFLILLGVILFLLVIAFVVPRLQATAQGFYGTRA
ncbi:p5 [Blackberry vein banding-associated virus]|uniref:p5 n=1 Tax=Blackberry vein banding-associated virus TaxID=1381464 RepID=S5TS76_9CLOS|nr:p5 [Blackberry vein banding-associated virus]AGS48180.1 p5 [Blackberry vein banding-associated virus]